MTSFSATKQGVCLTVVKASWKGFLLIPRPLLSMLHLIMKVPLQMTMNQNHSNLSPNE